MLTAKPGNTPHPGGDDPADRLMGPAGSSSDYTITDLGSVRLEVSDAIGRHPVSPKPSAGYRFVSAHHGGWTSLLSHVAHTVFVRCRVRLYPVTGIEAGTLAASAGVGRAPGRSGMVTRTLAVRGNAQAGQAARSRPGG